MMRWRPIPDLPLVVRVPAIVALLVCLVSAVISERVLSRLSHYQEQQLTALAATYLDGLSSSLMPAVLRSDIWEVFDGLDRAGSLYKSLHPVETIVTDSRGTVLAASDPARFPALSDLPADYVGRHGSDGAVSIDPDRLVGYSRRDLVYQEQVVGAIHAAFDVSHLFRERANVLRTLLITNGSLALVFAAFGFVAIRRMMAPLKVLGDHMRGGADGAPEPIARGDFPRRSGEVADLFHGFNALVTAECERGELAKRLAEEEKLSSLGRLASGMAHEINNPLGGLLNAIDTLRRHGDTPGVRDRALLLLERGLSGIRDVVEAMLATYRSDRTTRSLMTEDLEDIRLLIKPEIIRRRQTLDWQVQERCLPCPALPGVPVRQAVLNLLLNASTAAGDDGRIAISVSRPNDGPILVIRVEDDGPGLPPEAIEILTMDTPGPAVRGRGGLGLWMVRQMVNEIGGSVIVTAAIPRGTSIAMQLPVSAEGRRADAA